jgi:methylase of polypeptide subunit release factors
MTTEAILDPFAQLDPSDLRRLRDVFDRHGYTERAIEAVLPASLNGNATAEGAAPMVLRAIDQQSAIGRLIRLFLLTLPVPEAELSEMLGERLVAGLRAGNLLRETPGGLTCPVIILPIRGLYIVYDTIAAKLSPISKYLVMGVGSSSLAPANAAPRRHYRRALDLGCGGGFQSFHLATHCDEVVGLDINPRALNLGRAAAHLNRADNIEFRLSNFYAAVEGEKFDLIVSNPPFVISPESEFHYRDGGLGADRVTETVIRGAGNYLEEGGVAVIICEWATMKGSQPHDRLREWVAESGCDVWVSASKEDDLPSYAMNWLRSYRAHLSPAEFHRTYDRWLDYYDELNMQGIQTGLVVLRKRTGDNWLYIDEAPSVIRGRWGATLLQLIEIHTLLHTLTVDELLDQHFKLAKAARMKHVYQQAGNRWASAEAEILLEEPLPYSGRVDQYTAGLLARCDGSAPLRQLVAEMGEVVGVSFPEIVEAAMPILQGLMQRGYLIPVSLLPPEAGAPSA